MAVVGVAMRACFCLFFSQKLLRKVITIFLLLCLLLKLVVILEQCLFSFNLFCKINYIFNYIFIKINFNF